LRRHDCERFPALFAPARARGAWTRVLVCGPRGAGTIDLMTIGTSIFLIAVGAILKYAVTATVAGIEIQTVGLILMIAGVVGLVIGLFLLTQADRRRPVAYDERAPVIRAPDPVVR